jgi:hypothetical protein
MRAFLTFSVSKLQKAWRYYAWNIKLREAVRLRRLERAAQVRLEKERLLRMRQEKVLEMLKHSKLDAAARCVQKWYRRKQAAAAELLRAQRKKDQAMQEAVEEAKAAAGGLRDKIKDGLMSALMGKKKKDGERILSPEEQKADEDRAARLTELAAAKRKAALAGLVSPGARQKRKQSEIERIKFSIRSKQRETFLVTGLSSLYLTVGEVETASFQAKQKILEARGEPCYKRLKHDLGMYHYRGLQSANPVRPASAVAPPARPLRGSCSRSSPPPVSGCVRSPACRVPCARRRSHRSGTRCTCTAGRSSSARSTW